MNLIKQQNDNSVLKIEVEKYITDKNKFIVYLIGFLNNYTLKNKIIVKKYKEIFSS